ncbi:MAG: MmcQ/YjbR family DNA-binding protein [Alphaproteobacteria bacterium]|nr:MmcQ/YjbR family DNA-binding protein [Alphaproteobacteria bacterium]
MNLFVRDAFEAFVLALPATEIVRQWGDASVGKVGGKIFAIFGGDDTAPRLSFKCSDMAFELLPELDDIVPAPYLARAKWVAAGPGAPLGAEELAAYLTEAHRLVAGKLTARQKANLGLGDYLATR